MTKPNTSCTIELTASLRSDGVRVHPGTPFGFLSEPAFSFAGILTYQDKEMLAIYQHDFEFKIRERVILKKLLDRKGALEFPEADLV